MFWGELGPFQHNTEEWGQFVHSSNIYRVPITHIRDCATLCASEPSPLPAYILGVFHSNNHRGTSETLWEHKGTKCWAGRGNKFYPHFTDNDSEIRESSALLHHL